MVGCWLAVLALIIDGAWKSGLAKKTLACPFGCNFSYRSNRAGRLGIAYSWNLLTPMLLEYLANDAQAAGLSTEWRLSSFVGFIVSLLSCLCNWISGPLVTLLSLQSGAVDRPTLIAYRRHIWFITFVLGAAFSPPDPLRYSSFPCQLYCYSKQHYFGIKLGAKTRV